MQKKILNKRYELERKIGEGGMARVYLGRDTRLNRRVAVKVLHNHYASDQEFLDRFSHEAQAAANLHHPAIVDIYDVGQDDDIHYIVMEYVEGSDLKSIVLREGVLPVERATVIVEQAAEGLEAAHRVGLIHRDVKPQNILVGAGGVAKLTDFGIAKSALSTAQTETGVTFGTADYISPEQAQGRVATPQSDIYALGVTLYELLTGRLPFTGESAVAVALQHVGSAPPPLRLANPRLSPALEAIVLRAMDKDPARRQPSARALAQELREYRAAGDQRTQMHNAPVRPPTMANAPPNTAPAVVVTPPSPRTPPPRRAAAAPPAPQRGREFGVLLVGLLVIGMALGAIYLFATARPGDLLPSFGTAVPGATRTPLATVSPEAGGTLTPEVSPTPEILLSPAPGVIGFTEGDAIQVIERAFLRPVADPPRNSDTIAAGLVFEQFPAAGTPISQTTDLRYTVSLGPEVVVVPDVAGLRFADAAAQLRRLGFEVNRTEETNRLSADFVIRTDPQPGTRPRKGDTITVVVSLGNQVRMPDLAGLEEDDAKRVIDGLGLFWSFTDYQSCEKLGAKCDQFIPGMVVSSVPGAGDLVERGSGVTLGVRAEE